MVTSWADVQAAEPELAEVVEKRFGGYRHHVLATVRKDGSPRVSGLEVAFLFGEVLLGMMPGSRKELDLRRDPRCALQANPGPDTSMGGGDVRVGGRAVEVTDPDTLRSYVEAVGPPEPFTLFRLDLTEVVRTGVEGADLVVTAWRPGGRLRTIRRGTDASPPREDT
ncbi:pyridoxamine 5'-phosphate oxidase family protein [Streptomyces sp. URMC 123]|uniref:pyridoxamine 5'-phosphate oxidase family protein n=1 Tax=Streptomyces sp. URMC 123 TaxID=3423403 RepID=UPI003F1B550C